MELGTKSMKELWIKFLFETLPFAEAGLISGIVWGDKSGFSSFVLTRMKDLGIIHIMVVSGANLLIIMNLLVEKGAVLITRKVAIVIGLILVWIYAFMVGLSAPIVRALLFVSFYYLCMLVGRKFDVFRVLVLVIVMMLLINIKWGIDLGFWLSFTAFVAILTCKTKNIFWQSLWVSIWVTPILSMYVGKISVLSFVANGVVVGVIEMVTLVGLIAMVFKIKYLLWLIYPLVKYINIIIERIPSMVLEFKFNWFILIGWYLLLYSVSCKKR